MEKIGRMWEIQFFIFPKSRDSNMLEWKKYGKQNVNRYRIIICIDSNSLTKVTNTDEMYKMINESNS